MAYEKWNMMLLEAVHSDAFGLSVVFNLG